MSKKKKEKHIEEKPQGKIELPMEDAIDSVSGKPYNILLTFGEAQQKFGIYSTEDAIADYKALDLEIGLQFALDIVLAEAHNNFRDDENGKIIRIPSLQKTMFALLLEEVLKNDVYPNFVQACVLRDRTFWTSEIIFSHKGNLSSMTYQKDGWSKPTMTTEITVEDVIALMKDFSSPFPKECIHQKIKFWRHNLTYTKQNVKSSIKDLLVESIEAELQLLEEYRLDSKENRKALPLSTATSTLQNNPIDGERIAISRGSLYSQRSLYEFWTFFEHQEYGRLEKVILKEIDGKARFISLFEDVVRWWQWEGESIEEYEKRKAESDSPELVGSINGNYIERKGPAHERHFQRPYDRERIRVFTGKWGGWRNNLIYKDVKVGNRRGVIYHQRIITSGNGVREVVGDTFCNFEDIWQWKSEDNPSDGTMNGESYGDDSKIQLKEGLNSIQRQYAMAQDRFARPQENERIHAQILGVWIHGTYYGDSLQSDQNGSLPFRLVTCYKREETGANYAGPSDKLAGPTKWEELPADTEEMQYIRETIKWAEAVEKSEQAEKNIKQLQQELEYVETEVSKAHSEEHAIQVLTGFKFKGQYTDSDNVVHNFFQDRFPMYDSYISRINYMIDEREKAITLRHDLRQKFEPKKVAKVTIENPQQNEKSLFNHIAMLNDLAEPILREELVKDKFLTAGIDRDEDGRLLFKSTQQDVAYFVQEMVDGKIFSDTGNDIIYSSEFRYFDRTTGKFKKIIPKSFKAAREKSKNMDKRSALIQKTVKNILTRTLEIGSQ